MVPEWPYDDADRLITVTDAGTNITTYGYDTENNLTSINDAPAPGRASFNFLAEHYLKADFGSDAVRPKSVNTIPIVEHYVRDYLVKRFGDRIAEDIKPLEIQKWLKSLNEATGLAWTTVSKIRGLMHRIYKIGILHEHVSKNPVLHVETRSKSNYRAIIITPARRLRS